MTDELGGYWSELDPDSDSDGDVENAPASDTLSAEERLALLKSAEAKLPEGSVKKALLLEMIESASNRIADAKAAAAIELVEEDDSPDLTDEGVREGLRQQVVRDEAAAQAAYLKYRRQRLVDQYGDAGRSQAVTEEAAIGESDWFWATTDPVDRSPVVEAVREEKRKAERARDAAHWVAQRLGGTLQDAADEAAAGLAATIAEVPE